MIAVKTPLSRICLLWGVACLLSSVARCQRNVTREEEDEDGAMCTDVRYLDRCLSKLPKFVDQSLLRRMPVSEKEINSLCTGFQIGMRCINRYSSKCLDPAKKQFIDAHISGARKVFHSLCNDDAFRAEYLQHTLCLKGTQKNWESCVSQFTHLVREEIHNKNFSHESKVFQTCCAIHGFSRCIYVPGRLKCHKEAAVFLLKIAEMSIDQREYLRDCHRINNYRVCSVCQRPILCRLAFLALILRVVLHAGPASRLWSLEELDSQRSRTVHNGKRSSRAWDLEDRASVSHQVAETSSTAAESENLNEKNQRKNADELIDRSVSDSSFGTPPRLLCSYRLFVSIIGFFAFFNATLIRIGIVMAIVCMTKVISRNVTVQADCPPLEDLESDMLFEFDWPSELQGLIKSGAFYGFIMGPFVAGLLSFRFGGKIVLTIGVFCSGITYVFIPELTRVNPYFFFGIRILSGFFGGFIFPAMFDILSHWAVPEERQILVGGALIGVPLCSVVNFPINGFICTEIGWPWIFYLTTLWLTVYTIFIYFFAYNTPGSCPYLDERESVYIESQAPTLQPSVKVPWGKIFRSPPIYAYIVTHFCINYGFITIILLLPVFMVEVHHFHVNSNSLLSAAPYLGALISRIIMTYTFNIVRRRLKVTKNFLRKTYVFIGVAIPSIALIAVSQIPCKYRYYSLACFILFATALELSISGGYLLSLLDMCPSYNNVLSGIANAIANFAGLLSAVVTGVFTPNGIHEEYNIVFYISIAFLVTAGLTYIIFGSNELQPWGVAKPNQATDEDETRT